MLLWLVSVLALGMIALECYVVLSMSVTEESLGAHAAQTPRPYIAPVALDAPISGDTAAYFPYPVAVLREEGGTLESQTAYDTTAFGQTCRVADHVYRDAQGHTVLVRSATPSAYMTAYANYTLSTEAYTVADGLTAQYLFTDTRACLLLRQGETVYAVETESGKDVLLHAAAALTFE